MPFTKYPEGTLDANTEQRPSQDSSLLAGRKGRGSSKKFAAKSGNNKLISNNRAGSSKRKKSTKKRVRNKRKLKEDSSNKGPKERNDSFHLDKQIKRFSLNFSNHQFERQFRSTSDIASCISLIGLPITLFCSFIAYLYLYKM